MTKSQIDFELGMMGFAKSSGRDFLSAACLLYAGGMHRMQDITARISKVTGVGEHKIYNRMLIALERAWKNQERSPKVMYSTRVRPCVKKFIKLFAEQRMGEKSCSKTE